jgi:DNA (cytosine-5)-methyltransferase 1
MFETMNVLSLFDGMSCGQQALERSNIKVDNYFASEIDKYAMQVTMANYPNTKQLGSVIDVDGYSLPKIDLLIGGSPCQSFSFAGKRKGMSTKDSEEILTLERYLQLKKEGFEFEGQSYLFWEYMRLLYECKPKYFLLENVKMGEKWEKILSKAIGVNPIMINSSLVSAQNRQRLYWTNIGLEPAGLFGYPQSTIEQPKDEGTFLKDILQDNPNPKYYLTNKMQEHLQSRDSFKLKNGNDKSGTITVCGEGKQGNNSTFICEPIDEKYFLSDKGLNKVASYNNFEKSIDNSKKSLCLAAGYFKQGRDNQLIVHNTMPRSSKTGKGGTGPLSRTDGKTYCLDTGTTNAVEIREVKQINPSLESGGKQPYQQNRVYDTNGISPSLCANLGGDRSYLLNLPKIRRLTPIECERLQTVKDNYTNHVSDSQRYKMLGNGWTVDVICHLFSYIK